MGNISEKVKDSYNKIAYKYYDALWSDMPYPEAGGELRTIQLYLPGSSVELSLPENIIVDLCGMYDAGFSAKIFLLYINCESALNFSNSFI